ncbi:pilus assembly protein PilP [Actimicrobium sp. CCI2.3]|uniref:pilus assembly protein PilP n=1 Tax=Actimicrobium sp. CCI2.3 TaxID=3048616 RepID=UPI002AB586C8|nr:pilus assembly protein PilP [Actimicrobium sp. CCI2.3]MDY7573334.1 pilus assembly protein PilP [Actimicrobium sp. CCI2.3]MEB0021731.1 pilus assembly protein PilP [Actimicrobium sp. CCI2.3]
MTTWYRLGAGACSLMLIFSLAGCGDNGVPEIKSWMDGVRQQTRVSIPTLSPPKKFTPFSYEAKNLVDPYSPSKLAIAFAKLQANSSGLKPDMERRREPLEAYPIDVLKMVGTLQKPGLNYALILADKTLFQVRAGNYIGQNFGMVSGITETAVELKEIVQDASGEWVERKAKLELQEAKK